MKIVYNSRLPFKGFRAINLFGVVFARKEFKPLSGKIINHERIHTAQMREMLYVFFYVWYGLEWLILCFRFGFDHKKAYKNILFEKEAYRHDNDLNYLKTRRLFSWLK